MDNYWFRFQEHGLEVYLRNPNSYTPLREPMGHNGRVRSLLLSRDEAANKKEIAKFSLKDAEVYFIFILNNLDLR